MLCPNCQAENLGSSAFCTKCGKSFHRIKSKGSSGEAKTRTAKPQKKASTAPKPGPAKKASSSPKPVPSKKTSPAAKPTPPKKTSPPPKPMATPQPIPPQEPSEPAKPSSPPMSFSPPKPDPPKAKTEVILPKPGAPPKKRRASLTGLSHPKQLTLRVNAKRKVVPFLIIFFLAVIAIFAVLMISKPPAAKDLEPMVALSKDPFVAVLPFVNRTGNAQDDIWGKALAFALITDLSQSHYVKVLSGEKLHMVLKKLSIPESRLNKLSQNDLKRIAAQTGVNLIVHGDFSKEDGNIQVNATLKSIPTDSVTFFHKLEGTPSIFPMIDELTRKVKTTLNLSDSDLEQDMDINLQDITTSSNEAYKFYVAGKWYFMQKEYRQSIDAWEKCLSQDPEFAMAYIDMAAAYSALGYNERAWQKCQAAQRLVDSVSERERFYLQGEFYRRSEKTYDIAITVYNRLLELYPDDQDAITNLGILYNSLGAWEKAQAQFTINQNNKVDSQASFLGASLAYAMQGNSESARQVLNTYILDFGDAEDIRLHKAWLYLMQEDYAQALKEVKQAESLNSVFYVTRMKGDLFLLKGDLIAAEAEYNKLLEDDEHISQLWGQQRLANVYKTEGRFNQVLEQLTQGVRLAELHQEMGWKYRFSLELARILLESGKPNQALQHCDEAWRIALQGETNDFPREVLFLRGLAFLAQRKVRDAESLVTRLKTLCEKGPTPDRMRYYYHLLGEIEMTKGNYGLAVDHFLQAVDRLPKQGVPWWHSNDHAHFIDALAEAYYSNGNPVKALEELENLRTLSTGRLNYGDLYAKCYYKLGKIREENGLSDIAVDFYQRFLGIWDSADPGIPEVSDARQRLAASRNR